MHQFRRAVAGATCLGLFILLALGACSDSTGPDTRAATISGTVTDSQGDPVAGVSLLVSIVPSFADLLQPAKGDTTNPELPPPAGAYWLRIVNACGDTIRTLCDDGCDGQNVYVWDGLDDQGMRVVEGIYTYVLAGPEGFVTAELVLIHFYAGWDTETCGAHARTDAAGTFQLEDGCLGFGATITVTDENGTPVDEREVLRLIDLKVLAADGRMALRDSILFPESGNLIVDFTLPD